MSRQYPRVRTGEDRASLHDEITNKIIAELEAGRVPWVQPWGTAAAPLAMPKSAATGRQYSGINILILWGPRRARFHRSELAYISPSAVARWSRPQGRARHERRLCRPLCAGRRKAPRERER
jgi:N-terminal domain of anti-restriction factor ArdC